MSLISGAIADNDKYSELFLRITRAAGLLIPFVAVIYGIASATNIVDRSPAYTLRGFIIIGILFISLGVAQSIQKPSAPLSLGIYIGLYHLIGSVYLVIGPGFTSPIAFCWIVLTFITDIFYGRTAAVLSLAIVSLTALSIYFLEPTKSFKAIDYTVYLMIIIVSSVIIVLLRRVQVVEHKDLQRTQVQEKFQREQLTALVNSVGMAIASTSRSGTIRIYNAALLNLLDTNESLAGKHLDDVFHLIDEDGKPVSMQSILATSDHLIERDDLSHKFPDGETMNLSLSYAPIRGRYTTRAANKDGYIFIVRDITKTKSLEEERNEFISVVSHELRTPVAIAEGTISNLQFLLGHKQDPAKLQSALNDAHEQVVYLASMVNDLSTLSRAERGVADAPEPVNIKELLEELFNRYKERAESKGLELKLELPAGIETIKSSRLYLEEILHNFITNAIKYTESGNITIGAQSINDSVEFYVKDSGIGISKSDQKHIFDKFYRSEDYRTRKTNGTGLGLYVVRKLARNLGIEIVVESRLNHGSVFRFTLPKEAME
jgi:PAS domain S-box-containing protein